MAAAAPPVSRKALADVPEPELVRLTSETLAPLARTLDRARRLRAAEDRVAGELESLPAGFWLVERYVLVGTRRIPFLVAGATGVFVICRNRRRMVARMTCTSCPTRATTCAVSSPATTVASTPPMCLAFDEMKPRSWYGGEAQQGRGGWVMGLDWLKRWLFSFGPEHGLFNGDVRRLQEASGPFWDRRSTARLPASRNLG